MYIETDRDERRGTHDVINTPSPRIRLQRVILTYGACARVEEGEGLVSRLLCSQVARLLNTCLKNRTRQFYREN